MELLKRIKERMIKRRNAIEMGMAVLVLLGACILPQRGFLAVFSNQTEKQEPSHVIILDAGHGGGHLRTRWRDCQKGM